MPTTTSTADGNRLAGDHRPSRPRVIGLVGVELGRGNRQCTCCERELRGTFAWLELDRRTNTYHDFGGVPSDKSQGWFPFGMACARTAIRRARLTAPSPATNTAGE